MRKIIAISTHVHFKHHVSICFYLIRGMKREFDKFGIQFNDLDIFNQHHIHQK